MTATPGNGDSTASNCMPGEVVPGNILPTVIAW